MNSISRIGNWLTTAGFCLSFPLLAISQTGTVDNQTNQSPRQTIKTDRGIFTTRTNPITLPLPAEDSAFQFVIYGDRTGGDPEGIEVLKDAVRDTNLIDPDFVITVGDLIQGYNRPAEWIEQMKEFRSVMGGLNMDWFPVAGNHDIYWDFRDPNRPKGHHEANFEKHFGPLWYAFEHKGNGFIALHSDEGDAETGEKGFQEGRLQNVSPEQLAFLDETLGRLAKCQQIFVFLHHPRWLGGGYEGSNWPVVHEKLAKSGNVTGVFAGHIHHMTFEGPVDGIEYYTLATTGGHLAMDSPELGHLHHYNVVTVRENDFSVATFPVGAVMDPKDFKVEFLADVDLVRGMRPTRSGNKLALNSNGGVAGDYVISIPNPGKHPIEVTLVPQLTGTWKTLPDHQHVIIPAGKTGGMKFHFYRGVDEEAPWTDFAVPRFEMSVDYLHTSARVRLPAVLADVELSLVDIGPDALGTDTNRCLKLRGIQSASTRRQQAETRNDSARIANGDVPLPQGPFTLEAWVNPTDLTGSRAVVAKTQSSEYALFLHDGKPTFDVHLDGRYASPQADSQLPKNQWSHLAGVFDGRQARLYVNGKLTSEINATGSRTLNTLPLFVGADPDEFGNPTSEFAGQLDEIRLSTGVRYASDFEPAVRHAQESNTLLLLHMDREIGPFLLDHSENGVLVTKSGKATLVERN